MDWRPIRHLGVGAACLTISVVGLVDHWERPVRVAFVGVIGVIFVLRAIGVALTGVDDEPPPER